MTTHKYLSTGCLHGDHAYCQGATGAVGAKRPAECKFCGAPCICDCHLDPSWEQLYGNAKPSRMWFSRGWSTPWWHLIELTGIRGGDEWCNRTIGLRMPGGCLFLNLNFPMRTTMCEECAKL